MTRALAIVAGVLLVALLVVAGLWRYEHQTLLGEKRVAETATFQANDLLTKERVTSSALGKVAADLATRSPPAVQERVQKAEQLGAHLEEVDELVTEPAAAEGTPLPTVTVAAGGTCPPCLLEPGQPTQFVADEFHLRGAAGAGVLEGAIRLDRLGPGPRATIAQGIVSPKLSKVTELERPLPSTDRTRLWWAGGWAEWDPANIQGTPEYALELDRQLVQLGPVDLAAFAFIGRFYDGRSPTGAQAFTTQARAGVRAGWSFGP